MMSGKGKPASKKGLSKFKECGKSSSSKLKTEAMEVSSKDSPLTYPFIKTSENDRLLPRYSAILRRSEDEGVGMTDLDSLQLELESLLSAVALRSRALQEEIQALANAEERQDRQGKVSPLMPGKRMKSQERIVKKFKETAAKGVGDVYHSPGSNKIVKMKPVPSSAPSTSNAEAEGAAPRQQEAVDQLLFPKVVIPRNDTSNKFWAFVEPYCADVTPEDVKLLESLIEENVIDAEYYDIPSLGRHYTVRWSEEENYGDKLVKSEFPFKKEKACEGIATGPLTQRLFSALVEEKFVPVDVYKGDENRIPQLFKSFTVNNSASFERRVRKELEEQGIFDAEEMAKDEGSDEILKELKRCQEELKHVSSYNVQHLKRLVKLANEEFTRQDMKKKLQDADNDVMKMHLKVLGSKQMKEIVSEKEQELCWKALKDRDTLIRLIDGS